MNRLLLGFLLLLALPVAAATLLAFLTVVMMVVGERADFFSAVQSLTH